MASKTPDNLKSSPMEHVHVRLPNLMNQIAAAEGDEVVRVDAEGEVTSTEISTSAEGVLPPAPGTGRAAPID